GESKKKLEMIPGPRNAGLNALTWDYPTEGKHAEPGVESVLKEINGYTVADHKQLKHIQALKNDGSTACGAWIYCGVFPEDEKKRQFAERQGSGSAGRSAPVHIASRRRWLALCGEWVKRRATAYALRAVGVASCQSTL